MEQSLQYQPKHIVNYVNEFDFRNSDLTDKEITVLIDRLLDSRDVHSQHKFDVD